MTSFRVAPPVGRGAKRLIVGGPGRRAAAVLGRLSEFGPSKDVALDLDKQHVVAVIGKRGSGKTHTLGVLVEGLADAAAIESSAGVTPPAVVIFDTLNLFQWIGTPLADASGPTVQAQRDLLRRWGLHEKRIDARFLHPVGSEPAIGTSVPFSLRVADMDAQDWARLLRVDLLGEPLGHLLGESYRRAINRKAAGGPSIDDMLRVLRLDSEVQSDYSAETIRALRQRLGSFAASSVFDSSVGDWSTAIEPGSVSVFLLGRTPEDMRSVMVFLIIRRILEQRSAASEREKHALISGGASASTGGMPRAWLVIDEAQNVMPSSNATAANEVLVRYVREGRNHGLSLAISTQQPAAIDAKVMAQVDTLIAHTLTVRADVSYVLSNLKSAEPDHVAHGSREMSIGESIRSLEAGQCLLSSTESPRSLYVDIRPRQTLHGGFEA